MMETVFSGDHLTLSRSVSVKKLRDNEPNSRVHQFIPDAGEFHLQMCYMDVSLSDIRISLF